MSTKIDRRDFLKKSAFIGLNSVVGGSLVAPLFKGPFQQKSEMPVISIVSGSDYLENTRKAVDLLGGMGKYVPKGSRVAVLLNTQSKNPGTYTKPEVARAVIRMCQEAGAKEINCLGWLPQRFWDATGLAQAAAEEGALLKIADLKDESQFRPIPVPKGKVLEEAKIMNDLFDNDVFINMPIVKDHVGNKFTGAMKNMMGLNFPGVNRFFHTGDFKSKPDDIEHLDQCIADLNTVLEPALCVVDATEFIITNGPFGPGNLIKPLKIVAGTDRVAVDAYCSTLWGMKPKDIIMIKRGFEHGLGEMDLKKIRTKEAKT